MTITAQKRLSRIAAPYLVELGLGGTGISFTWEYLPCFGEFRALTNGKYQIAIDHELGVPSRIKTLRRTLAHECYHVFQHVNGLPRTERDAEAYAKRALTPLSIEGGE